MGTPVMQLTARNLLARTALAGLASAAVMLLAIWSVASAQPTEAMARWRNVIVLVEVYAAILLSSYGGWLWKRGRLIWLSELYGEQTWKVFGNRWTGITSQDDEALLGLRATLEDPGRLVPRRSHRDAKIAFGGLQPEETRAEALSLARVDAWRPSSGPVGALFDVAVAPLLDKIIWARVRAASLGFDIPGLRCVAVERFPITTSSHASDCPMSLDLEAQLAERAAAESSAVLFAARRYLRLASVGGLAVARQQRQFSAW